MRLIDLGSLRALDALALEEAILQNLDSGGGEPAWLMWISSHLCAVLGTARPAAGDLRRELLEADGVPFWRRRSGGGTVLLGPASPVVTVVTRSSGGIRKAYRDFHEVLAGAMARLGIQAVFRPPADMAVGDRKIAGLAQRRKRRALMVTASVLAGSLAAESERYLAEPDRKEAPEYRRGRRHREFMTSLNELGLSSGASQFFEAMRSELSSRGASPGGAIPPEVTGARAITEELEDPEWIRRM